MKPLKTASFQCRLLGTNKDEHDKPLANDILNARLSHMDVMHSRPLEQNIPKMNEMYSFLANHETVYFNTNITTEEFNNIVATYEPHTTLALCWTAAIVQNSIQRLAYGQHFVQLRNIYERRTCPPQTDEIKQFKHLDKDLQKELNIDAFYRKKPQEINEILSKENTKNNERLQPFDEDEDDDFWEPNETYVGQRCLIEDDSFLLAGKA